MYSVVIPTPRKGRAIGALRRAWTAPTNFVGHAMARMLGCGWPRPIGGEATRASLYCLPAGRLTAWRAVAIGHVIIVEPALLARHGRWLLAHELSHARQHDWLGPVYLPAHAMLLTLSAAISLFRPVARFSPWHAYNPLERVMICVPIDALVGSPPPQGALADDVLRAFGLGADHSRPHEGQSDDAGVSSTKETQDRS
jgi:hypothetical protein